MLDRNILLQGGATELRRLLLLLGLAPSDANAIAREHVEPLGAGLSQADIIATYRVVAPLVGSAFGLTAEQRAARVLAHASRLDNAGVAEAIGTTPEALDLLLEGSDALLRDLSGKRALILEDDGIFRRHLEECCTGSGAEVVCSTRDPVLSVLAAQVFQPGLALVDLTIGSDELAGDLAAMQIREVAPDAAVVFVTGYGKADRVAAQMSRAIALIKPVSTGALTRAIRDAFRPAVSAGPVA